MNQLEPRYEITRKDLAKDKALRYGAWTAPVLLSTVPALIFFVLFFLFGTSPPAAFSLLAFSVISLIAGFIIGLVISGSLLFYRSRWLANVRERLAVDGIKANEVEWFQHELKTSEKKSLKEIGTRDLLLADAFRDTLAARLTASRILKSSKQELLFVKKRQNKLKYLKSENSTSLQEELTKDFEKLNKINREAEEIRVEAETRLQMIEAASRRGGTVADAELALKKLSVRTAELPLALEAAKESAKIEEEIRKELENEELFSDKK